MKRQTEQEYNEMHWKNGNVNKGGDMKKDR